MTTLETILTECFGMKPTENKNEQRLMQLADFDSMNHMIFISRLEESFGIELTGDEIADMATIGDIHSILSKKNISK